MGGSLGLALKAKRFAGGIAGYARREETRREAVERGAIDEALDAPEAAVAGADVVVLCVPVLSMPGVLARCLPGLRRGCLVTDVGSTKATLAQALPPLLREKGADFLGGHPIAGSEQQGLASARADLYEGSVVVLTPANPASEAKNVERLRQFWKGVGAVVHVMPPEEHDRILARTSHLPHMIAALLAATVARGEDAQRFAPFCGTGFRDTTRIAAGSPDVWQDITASNRDSLLAELRAFGTSLDHLVRVLAEADEAALRAFLEKAGQGRHTLLRPERRPPGGAP